MSDKDYAKLGVEPVAGDNPAGEDIQFDDDYEVIRREIGKLDSVTGVEENTLVGDGPVRLEGGGVNSVVLCHAIAVGRRLRIRDEHNLLAQ